MQQKNHYKLLLVITICLVVANGITLALLWSDNTRRRPGSEIPDGGRPEPVFEYVSRELGLSQQQREQYDVMREEHHRLQRLLQDSVATARHACFATMKLANASSDSNFKKMLAQTSYYQQQLELLNYNHFKELRGVCDAAQQAKLDSLLDTILKRLARPGPPPPDRRR